MMKKKMGEIILCALMVVAVFSLMTGCKRDQRLKGMEIVIGNWWQNYDTDTFQPQNDEEEKTLRWRTRIQRENDFRMSEKYIAGWNEMPQVAFTSIMGGRPRASVFVLQGNWAISLINQSLAYPVSDNTVVDLRNPQPVARGRLPPEWNQSTIDNFTFGGKTYAFSVGINLNNANVVFFNKRLFREAGLDPNIPYDMQRDGTWTWDNFFNLCKQLTRDLNNDGIIDIYALPRDLSIDVLDAVIASNGAQYVGRDPETGKFFNATNTPEFLEALRYTIMLNNEGVMKPRPDPSSWDWYKNEFIAGNVAMYINESYAWNDLQRMRDDWGVVIFPKGPRVSDYRVYTRENVFIIPSTFTAEQVDQIMYAMALWYTPQSDDWRAGMYSLFRDSRAVNETLALIRDTSRHINKNYVLVPNLERGHIAWYMWGHEGDPAQLVESVSANWNALISDLNNVFFP